MENIIIGVFEYGGKEYPFILRGQILSVPQSVGQYNGDFDGITDIPCIQGVTNNQSIFFIGCRVVRDGTLRCCVQLDITISAYIISGSELNDFCKIAFYSPAINAFYSPRVAYNFEPVDTKPGIPEGIRRKEGDEFRKEYNCNIDGEDIRIGLDVDLSFNMGLETGELVTAKSVLYMDFSSPRRLVDSTKYCLYLMDFLCFTNFRKSVPISDIRIFSYRKSGERLKYGKLVVFLDECEDYKPNSFSTITYSDLPEPCFSTLFQHVAQKRFGEKFNPFLYPKNVKENRWLDAAKWLITAVGFEGEFDLLFPEYKAQRDDAFRQTKQMLLDTIQDKITQSGKGRSNKSNKALRSFEASIKKTDTTIKEKFEACEEELHIECNDAITSICRECKVPDDKELAQVYADYRNNTAHGKIRMPGNAEVAVYRILRCFIYAINLRMGGVPAEDAKQIIDKMKRIL